MKLFFLPPLLLLLLDSTVASALKRATGPFFSKVDDETWTIGNEIWNMTQQATYGVKLYYKDHDCVGNAAGHYVAYNGANLKWTSASVVDSGTYNSTDWIDVSFVADEGDMHWVIFAGLAGAYQYFVNRALPELQEFRTLWRLDNATFTRGRTNIRDDALPSLADYLPGNKVQDETWRRPDNSGYITKYDFAAFVRTQTAYGVYGSDAGGFGSWYVNPGKDYYSGDHLRQDLMMHRESVTGDVVHLNMLHGKHFMVISNDSIPVGMMWGPWLWYLNDGDVADAEARAAAESKAWPYAWLNDTGYQSRSTVKGRITLSADNDRPAAYAAVFLGDNKPDKSSLAMGSGYYYTTYADADGAFSFTNVRAGTYGLQAWPNGTSDELANVTARFQHDDVDVQSGDTSDLGTLTWTVADPKQQLFRVGDFDRYAYGFAHGGAPREHGLVAKCPTDLKFTVGSSATEDWCFGQTYQGKWAIVFEADSIGAGDGDQATLIVSLAGYSSGASATIYANGQVIGNMTSGSEDLPNDPGLYRSATVAGEWHYLEFAFDAGILVKGTNNVTFEVTQNSTWHGFMWDSIILEL